MTRLKQVVSHFRPAYSNQASSNLTSFKLSLKLASLAPKWSFGATSLSKVFSKAYFSKPTVGSCECHVCAISSGRNPVFSGHLLVFFTEVTWVKLLMILIMRCPYGVFLQWWKFVAFLLYPQILPMCKAWSLLGSLLSYVTVTVTVTVMVTGHLS